MRGHLCPNNLPSFMFPPRATLSNHHAHTIPSLGTIVGQVVSGRERLAPKQLITRRHFLQADNIRVGTEDDLYDLMNTLHESVVGSALPNRAWAAAS